MQASLFKTGSSRMDAPRKRYAIRPDYRHRETASGFDDRGNQQEFQKSVYQFCCHYALHRGYRRIADFGCGSGFKLMSYLGGFDTTGFELEPSLSCVKECYPDRKWCAADLETIDFSEFDLVVVADVIEHLADPDDLMSALARGRPASIVFSTPAREILIEQNRSAPCGPPRNPSHFREWTTREFAEYVGTFFEISGHVVINPAQATQLVLVDPEKSRKDGGADNWLLYG
ncbi:MAG: hypothetical protein Tsb0019_26530 [Roseibium sp.]